MTQISDAVVINHHVQPVIKCMHISDTHEANIADIVITDLKDKAKEKEGIDILFISGDMTYRGAYKKLKKVREQLTDLIQYGYVSDVAVTPGNHELSFQRADGYDNPVLARSCFQGNANIHLFLHEAKEIQGIKIFGSPWTPEFHNWAYNYFWYEAENLWNQIPNNTQVLMTHGPPEFIMDEVHEYMKVKYCGCPVLAKKIVNTPSIKYHLFGHIHEGYGTVEKQGTTYMNSSIMDGNYKPTNKPQYFTI